MPESQKSEITIQGLPFAVTTPYVAGHALTEAEASQLNQVRAENIRNNFAARIKKHIKDAVAKAAEAGQTLSEEDVPLSADQFQEDFDKLDAEYQFGLRRVGAGPAMSPLEKEARKIARERIVAKLAERGVKVKDLREGQMDEYIEKFYTSDAIQKEAKRRIDSINKIALDTMDLGDEPVAAAA